MSVGTFVTPVTFAVIVKNVFRVPPVLGSTVKILEKAMVLSKGSFIGLLKVTSGLVS